MKLISTLLFTLFVSGSALAQECSPEDKELLINKIQTIENGILKLTQEHCDEENTESLSVCSFESAKVKYNKTLAKLVLAEGLESLKSDIEISFEKLKTLRPEDFKNSVKIINKFQVSIDKGEALKQSLVLKDGKRIIDEYYNKNQPIEEFLTQKCKDAKEDNSFCQKLSDKTSKKEISEFLGGFFDTYEQADPDLRNQRKNFKGIIENLEISLSKDETIDIDKLKEHDSFKKISELKEAIKLFSISKSKDGASKINKLVTSLQENNIQLKNNTSIHEKIDRGIKEKLQRNISNLSSAYNILNHSSYVKDEIKKTKSIIAEQSNSSITTLEQDIEKDFERECHQMSTAACIRELKKDIYNARPGVSEIRSRFSSIIESDKYNKLMSDAETCLESKEEKSFKAKCIEDLLLSANLKTDNNITDLKKELKANEALLLKFSSSPEIATLEEQKIEALVQLNENNCLDNEEVKVNCNKSDITSYNKGTIKLSNYTGDILVSFNLEQLRSKLVEIEADPESPGQRKNKKTITTEQRKEILVKKKKALKQSREIAAHHRSSRRKTKRQYKRDRRRANSDGSGAAFVGALSQSMMAATPNIMYRAHQRRQLRAEADRRRQYYSWTINNLQNGNYSNYNNGMYMNWGGNYYNPYYANNFNYNNPYLYNNNSSYYTQYTYGQNNIGATTSGSPTATNSTSGSTNFSYGF